MDPNAPKTPQTSAPQVFNLPPLNATSPSGTSSPAPTLPNTLSPESQDSVTSKKKWIKIGVIAGVAVLAITAILYFGRSYLFKGELAIDPKQSACDDIGGVYNPDVGCKVGLEIYAWDGAKWNPPSPPPEEVKAEPEAKAEEPVALPEEVKAPEGGAPLAEPEKEIALGEGVLDVCDDADYNWGEWSMCKEDGTQYRIGMKRNKCVGDETKFEQQACGVDADAGAEVGAGAGKAVPAEAEEKAAGDKELIKEPELVGSGVIGEGAAGDKSIASAEGGAEESKVPEASSGSGEVPISSGSGVSAGTEGVPAPVSTSGGPGYGGGGGWGPAPSFVVKPAPQVSQGTEAVRVSPQTAQESRATAGVSERVAQVGTAQAASGVYGAYIQGQTGPEMLIYPVIIAGANALYFLRRRKRKI